jgi:glycerol-3-phosphate dehydrogenase (NAD(P)+)
LHTFGVLGSGSWATAITKMLTDNGNKVHWYIRNTEHLSYIQERRHNPHYLTAAYFNTGTLQLYSNINEMFAVCNTIVIAIPAAYIKETLANILPELIAQKRIITAVKGIIPGDNILLHELLWQNFKIPIVQYYALMGPCHAEEVAGEKLSYLTLAGLDKETTSSLAQCFNTPYINIHTSTDVIGVQYAAVLKNIYAIGAGIAHGLDYGDNFLSVLISNSAHEMTHFLSAYNSFMHDGISHATTPNYISSVYLGDLLVTCYSLYSRNRSFGTMIGKGYGVKAAQIEMNMVAEGYNASNCLHSLNTTIKANIPIANTVYEILHKGVHAKAAFQQLEATLI